MADRFISQLAADTNNANVARGDLFAVNRGGIDYKAAANAELFVPAATAADSGKVLTVNQSGVIHWAEPAGGASNFVSLWTGSVRVTQGADQITIDSGRSFADYTDITLVYNHDANTQTGQAQTLNGSVTVPWVVLRQSTVPHFIPGTDANTRTIFSVGANNTRTINIVGALNDPTRSTPANNFHQFTAIYGSYPGRV